MPKARRARSSQVGVPPLRGARPEAVPMPAAMRLP